MQKPKSLGGQLIVVELGAEWPSLSEVGEPAARRVLAQRADETPAAFGRRVSEQLAGLFTRGMPLSTAIIACNERLDDAAQRERTELGRTAMGALAQQRSGRLLLSASDRNGGRSRHALSALCRTLSAEWQRAGVEAVLRFGEEPLALKSSDMPARVSAHRRKGGARQVA
jgi:hypothetical protein